MLASPSNDHDPTTRLLRSLVRQNRILWALVAVLGFLVAGADSLAEGFADAVPAVIEAQRFVLRDAQGAVRGEWALQADGKLRLVVFKDNGRIEAEFPGVAAPIPASVRR